MRRFLATTAVIAISLALVTTSAAADESGNSASSAALAACKERAQAKKVTVTIKVDGKATTYRYVCSEILAAAGKVPAAGDFTIGLDVLAKQVGIRGIFSDWAGTVTYYANCMGLK